MTAGQMLLEKPIDMEWANLSRGDVSLRKPLSEVRHDSGIQAHGARSVTPTAEIPNEGLGNYVNLRARVCFTIAGIPT